ncbi:MAG: TonB-dependent receptor [Bacteroidetes bacterium]|nr:TonB-dependent receptor [Bacteroidota bacterium]
MNHIYRTAAGLYRHCRCLYVISFLSVISTAVFSQTDSLDIYSLDLHQLSELKIESVMKVEQVIKEVPSTIHIITASEIFDKGYFTLNEALSDLPGFQLRDMQSLNSYVFQRGIPNQNNLTLLLIDGIQINELNSGGFYGGALYNLSNVERIEVIYGPASVVYGTNAVSGIINIVTKKAADNRLRFDALLGSFNTSAGSVGGSLINDKKDFSIRVSGMFKKTDKADLRGSSGDNNWTDLMDNFENDYAFDVKVNTGSFTFGINYLNRQSSTAAYTKSIGTIYRDYGTLWNIRFINGYAKYNTSFSQSIGYSSSLYYRNTTVMDNTIYYVVDTAQIGCYRPNDLIGFENILNYDVNRFFSLTGGMVFEYERLSKGFSLSYSDSPEHKPPTPAKPPILENNLTSIFFEPRLNILEGLFLSAGFRFDKSSVYDEVFTPRVGLSYKLADHIFRLSYAEAFRAPKPWDYTDGFGNSSLFPEEMRSVETAVSLSPSNNFKIDLTAYKNILDQAITKEFVSGGYKWINSGEVNTDGMELFLRYFIDDWRFSLNYTFNQSCDETGTFIPEISKHTGGSSITYSFGRYFRVNLRANYAGKRENPKIIASTNSTAIDPYLILNCTLSVVDYEGFNIQLSVKNLLDKEYYHTSNRDPDRYRQPQRTVFLSVGYRMSK